MVLMTQNITDSDCTTCSSNDAIVQERTYKKRYELPKTVVIPLTVKVLDVEDIRGYLHVSQGTILRWFREKGLRQLISVRGSYTSREYLKEFLKERDCLVIDEQSPQTDSSIE
jgi:hypothetical protein